MARRMWLALTVTLALAVAACAPEERHAGDSDEGGDKARVVVSLFPLAELARAVGGPDIEVVDITPPGVEPHDLEVSSREVDRIEDADVVLYVGEGFQPGVERAVGRATGRRLDVLTALDDLLPGDPHVWLDPGNMARLAVRLADVLAEAAPGHADAFRQRATDYRGRLDELDREFRTRLSTCERHLLITTHDAFGYLARSYRLIPRSLTGLTPDAEPDPKRLAQLVDLVRAERATTVFTEGTEGSAAAEALAREAGVRTAVLHTLEVATDGGYVGGMRANLDTIAAALGCRP